MSTHSPAYAHVCDGEVDEPGTAILADCGCEYKRSQEGEGCIEHYQCPLHAAAPELLKALDYAAAGFATIANNKAGPAVREFARDNFRAAKAAIKAAIAKAEGS